MAVDKLNDCGGTLAALSDGTKELLDKYLPAMWSQANPVDIVGDADGERYAMALDAILADQENDAILVLQVPTALSAPLETAKRVSEVFAKYRHTPQSKPLFSAWVGESPETARIFAEAKIPHFSTESDAVRGFMHLVRYREAQEALAKVPPSLPGEFSPNRKGARELLRKVAAEERKWLDPDEVAVLFKAYQIPTVPVAIAATPEEAAQTAKEFLKTTGSVAVKIFSREILHKSDIGGVELNLRDSETVREAAAALIEKAQRLRPDARVQGVIVQPMIVKQHGRELIAGIADDATFGPVILFGRGGTAVEVINDKALALPPLDLSLAARLIQKTRVARRLKAYRNVPAVDEGAIALTLVKLSQMTADLAEISEIDINPLVADERGVVALDARVAILSQQFTSFSNPRFAIKPYPSEWEREVAFGDNVSAFIRPIRPEDQRLLRDFVAKVSPNDLRLRFFAPIRELSDEFLARLTQLDYSRAIALIALNRGKSEILGVVRLHIDANFETGEYAVLVRSDLKGRGLGWRLMALIIDYARANDLQRIEGQALSENTSMLKMCNELGFEILPDPDDTTTKFVRLNLSSI
jgi:acetyltransferase